MNDKLGDEAGLPWTGERYLPSVGGSIELEHLHRYAIAALLVRDQRVLDIASGEGYGSDMLALAARHVTGVDIATEAVAHARARYRRPNLEYQVGSAAEIPLPDASVDAVVSFETIEHHDQHERMMVEIKRVLVPGGLLLISSPNRRNYSIVPGYANPYHVKELFTDEFEHLLRAHFASVSLFGQRVVFGSLVVPDGERTGPFHTLTRGGADSGLSRPLYDLALASDGALPDLSGSLFEMPIEGTDPAQYLMVRIQALGEMVAERDARVAETVAERDARAASDERNRIALEQALAERDRRIASLHQGARDREDLLARTEHALAQRESELDVLRYEVVHRDQVIAEMVADRDAKLKALHDELTLVTGSRSWRATALFRQLNELRRRPPALGRFSVRFPGLRGRRARAWAELVRASPLFDRDYYLQHNPDIVASQTDPALHYVVQGWKELRDPSAAFSTARYLLDHADVAGSGVNPLIHYLLHGQQEHRVFSPASASPSAVAAMSVGVGSDASSPRPTTALDEEVRAIRASGLFDEPYYLAMYGDIQPPPSDPVRHYCERGWREGRDPSEDFDTGFYLKNYADIRAAGLNPFYHYVIAGLAEQRYPVPDLATPFESDIWFGLSTPDVGLIAFYALPQWAEMRTRRPLFKGHAALPGPHDAIGFYDPEDAVVLERQARMARRHGLRAFCFELPGDAGSPAGRPLARFLAHEDIDFEFCVRVVAQDASALDTLASAIAAAASDRRYVRVGARPMVVVLTPDGTSQAERFVTGLRRAFTEHIGHEPFLVVQGRAGHASATSDATLDLPLEPIPEETGAFPPRDRGGVDVVPYGIAAAQGVERANRAARSPAPVLPVVTLARALPGRDSDRPLAYARFHTRYYRRWLDAAIGAARATSDPERRFVFLESWNAWSEGLALEPDRQSGFARLNETSRALCGLASGVPMPKVSVIVPNFNHEPFLRRRLDSIYRQTYKNIEVILLDDCSSDGSRILLDEYAAIHPETTRKLYNETNSGSAFRQWARGIRAATGDLVWIAESDDYCEERFLETLVRCFDDEAVLLAYARSAFVDRNGFPIRDDFEAYLQDLDCAGKWDRPYVETAHNEVRSALGIKNTIPNASAVLFKRPLDMPLLDDPAWLTMKVAGDWVFYLHVLRGGKIAYTNEVTSYFRRYEGSAAERTYRDEVYFREVGRASRAVAALYNVPLLTLEQCRLTYRQVYWNKVGRDEDEFWQWYDYASVLRARDRRVPNVMICTMGFYPGGAEILPIRLANEFRRRGLSVLMLSAGLNRREDGVRRMLRNDVPVVETSSVEATKAIIRDFGIECLNTHQWYIQKYPVQLPDVFDALRAHVASLHGMIEHGNAFKVTEEELRAADAAVTTWAYTAEKNLAPFRDVGLYHPQSGRFIKIPNGMEPPEVVPIPRAELGIPEDAFVLCCVSRAIPDKGWSETIEVVARARALSGRDIRLILVGNGPVYDEYCRSGTPDFVYLAGFNEDSVGHYGASDMGIMLTKFRSESFPLTVVDCLFAGRPYMASDVGDIRNMLTTSRGVAGALVSLQDWEIPVEESARLVAAFASDRARYERAAALVDEAARRYRIDTVAEQYVTLFMASRGRSPKVSVAEAAAVTT